MTYSSWDFTVPQGLAATIQCTLQSLERHQLQLFANQIKLLQQQHDFFLVWKSTRLKNSMSQGFVSPIFICVLQQKSTTHKQRLYQPWLPKQLACQEHVPKHLVPVLLIHKIQGWRGSWGSSGPILLAFISSDLMFWFFSLSILILRHFKIHLFSFISITITRQKKTQQCVYIHIPPFYSLGLEALSN